MSRANCPPGYRVAHFGPEDVPAVVALWRCCFPDRYLTETGVQVCTLEHPCFDADGAFVIRTGGGDPVAFGLGADYRIPESGPGPLPGCIPVILVHPDHRKRGLGGHLLSRIEAYLQGRGHRILEPGYPGYAQDMLFSFPGVDAAWLEAAWFFRHYGYRVVNMWDCARADLEAFAIPDPVRRRMREAAEAGIAQGRLEPGEAEAFLHLLKREFGDSWYRSFARRIEENTLDFESVVVLRDRKGLAGFVGPFQVYESGTAAMGIGIGLAEIHRGKGLGAVLLYGGLDAMRRAGARSCTLYGAGPKRYYENAGFRLERIWLRLQLEVRSPRETGNSLGGGS